MDWKVRENINSCLHLWARVSLSALCVRAVRYGSDKGGRGWRIGMIKAKAAIDSLLYLDQPIARIEVLIGFCARTKAASVEDCDKRADETCSSCCLRGLSPALREKVA